MKPFKINPKSWHFRLANWINDGNYAYHNGLPDDFCTYARNVFYGLTFFIFIACVAIAGVTGVLACIGITVYWIYSCIAAATMLPIPVPAILTGVVVLGTMLYRGCRVVASWHYDRKRAKYLAGKDQSAPGFIATWFATTKGKFCLPIEMKDD